MEAELNFPRGGAERNRQLQSSSEQTERPSKKKSRKRSESNDFLFGTNTTPSKDERRSSKKAKKAKKSTESTAAVNNTVSTLPLGGGAVQPPSNNDKKKPAFIESVSFQKLGKGMKLLGIVREVAPDYAVVSLPSMLTGFIRRDSNSGIRVDHIVSVGMVLPVVLLKATSETVNESSGNRKSQPVVKRRIELTVSPLAVNNGLTNEMLYEGLSVRGRIRSVEDHGCLIDLNISGMEGSKCFLKYENIEGGYKILDEEDDEMGEDEDDGKYLLNKGRVYDFTIASLPSTENSTLKIYQVKLESSENRSKHVTDPVACRKANHTIRSLSPGMLLSVNVEHFARNGLCVSFMGNIYRGAIDSNNLGGYLPEDFEGLKDKGHINDMWWRNVFTGKLRNFDARLIAVDPMSKIIRFSIAPHILALRAPPEQIEMIGKTIADARVVRLDQGVGALLALPQPSDDTEAPQLSNELLQENPLYEAASKINCAYVHISKAMDNDKKRTTEAQFAKKFTLNAKIPKLRILGCGNWMDNIYSCATAESVVNSAVLSHLDLKPGMIYRAVPVIANLDNGGVLVQLGIGVKGLIPEMHLFDKSQTTDGTNNSYRNKVKMEKYKVGKKVDVRCLMISPSEKKCILTAKKALITSDIDDPIIDYASIQNNRTATGFISRVSKQGIAITFYHNVFGRISARKLADELGVEDPTVDYNVGDVVKVKIRRCFKKANDIQNDDDDDAPEDSYMLDLSLNFFADDNATTPKNGENTSEIIKLLKPGMVLKSKCMKIIDLVPSKVTKDSFLPGHAVVSIKAKHIFDDHNQSDKSSLTCKLPYEHILDSQDPDIIASSASMDTLASKMFTVGKKIAQEAIIVTTTNRDGSIATPIISLKPSLVETAKDNLTPGKSDILLPTQSTGLFMGAFVRGYCVRIHQKYGAFIRFLGGLTAIVPKLKGGLDIGLYDTVLCKIVAMDVMSGSAPKILLKRVDSLSNHAVKKAEKKKSNKNADIILPGDLIEQVRVDDINFARAEVTILDEKFSESRLKARIHMTMAKPLNGKAMKMPISKSNTSNKEDDEKVTKYHPFATWKVGSIVKNIKCVAIDVKDGVTRVELTNREDPLFESDPSHVKNESIVSGIITSVAKQNKGLWVQICPGVNGFIPGLELSSDIKVLNNLRNFFKVGGQVTCRVIEDKNDKGQFKQGVRLSLLGVDKENTSGFKKPVRGDIVVGRVNRFMKQHRAPALMVELPGGFLGRCDITELEEVDDWVNMPLGQLQSDGDEMKTPSTDNDEDENDTLGARETHLVGDFHHGLYIECRVLSAIGSTKGMVEISLRRSRIDGDLDNDEPPEEKDIVHAYVVSTTKKGCFLRLSRFVEGRVILKELSDSFLPDPSSMFPPGRLVVGKVKIVNKLTKNGNKNGKNKVTVDLDMRESVLLEDQNKLSFDDVKEGEKYRGVVTRIESYGVFVRFENSEISGLVHLSECSDDYVKNLVTMFNPGDLVKVLVLRVEKEERRIGLSMKPSHFEDDDSEDDSDLDSSVDSDDDEDVVMRDVDAGDLNSDDEDFVSKLAKNMDSKQDNDNSDNTEDDSGNDDSDDDEDSEDDDDSETDNEDVDIKGEESRPKTMDTDVGFDWGNNVSNENQEDADSDSSDDEDDEDEDELKVGVKNKKNSTAKRREEKTISKMEQRIADGTADANPETTADFERLIASDPNSSELWIKFMAYHLSLADIESARSIANRAFERIEFREEGEKLNVWTALITLENKYGTLKSLNDTIDRASQHNNAKQVYLRVCEMMEKDVETSHGDPAIVEKADEMFAKMCKKFKSKKTVWIANFKYLLKNGRNDEAHKLWKRSAMSLPPHKHIESMSKFAQLEYEFGSAERARTIFDALLDKHPKRMDLIFVYVDKEVKHGEVNTARRIFERISNPPNNGQKKAKFNDKQMKSLFKKWYRMEEDHGNDESMMHVKVCAKDYVERNTK